MRATRNFVLTCVGALAVLLCTASHSYADVVTCTANLGQWRWANGVGSRLDLTTAVSTDTVDFGDITTTYLDALRKTESQGTDPGDNSSRQGLDQSMPERFTTGPQPWGVAYSDKKTVTLTNFSPTISPDIPLTWTLGDAAPTGSCVPSDAVITNVSVHVTHAFIDPGNKDNGTQYQARIRVLDGLGVWQPYPLTLLATNEGIADEQQEDVTIYDSVNLPTGLLSSAALLNAANIEFQAARDGQANRAILNEISLNVTYTCTTCTPPNTPPESSLVTGGGYVTVTSGRKQLNANFGFVARNEEGVPGAAGVLQYNDGNYNLHGTVTSIDACQSYAPDIAGGYFKVSGTYIANQSTGKKTLTGNFTLEVKDNGEPGKGSDRFYLKTTSGGASIDTSSGGGSVDSPATLLTGGNIQFHFCNQ